MRKSITALQLFELVHEQQEYLWYFQTAECNYQQQQKL